MVDPPPVLANGGLFHCDEGRPPPSQQRGVATVGDNRQFGPWRKWLVRPCGPMAASGKWPHQNTRRAFPLSWTNPGEHLPGPERHADVPTAVWLLFLNAAQVPTDKPLPFQTSALVTPQVSHLSDELFLALRVPCTLAPLNRNSFPAPVKHKGHVFHPRCPFTLLALVDP